MIAGTPLFDRIHRAHRNVSMKSPRGEHVIELKLGGRRIVHSAVVGGHIPSIRGQARRPWVRAPARRVLGSQKLQAQRLHPLHDAAIAGRERIPIVVGGAVDLVEVAGGRYAVRTRIFAAYKCR